MNEQSLFPEKYTTDCVWELALSGSYVHPLCIRRQYVVIGFFQGSEEHIEQQDKLYCLFREEAHNTDLMAACYKRLTLSGCNNIRGIEVAIVEKMDH